MQLEELLTRGVAEIIVKQELEERLRAGRRLRRYGSAGEREDKVDERHASPHSVRDRPGW